MPTIGGETSDDGPDLTIWPPKQPAENGWVRAAELTEIENGLAKFTVFDYPVVEPETHRTLIAEAYRKASKIPDVYSPGDVFGIVPTDEGEFAVMSHDRYVGSDTVATQYEEVGLLHDNRLEQVEAALQERVGGKEDAVAFDGVGAVELERDFMDAKLDTVRETMRLKTRRMTDLSDDLADEEEAVRRLHGRMKDMHDADAATHASAALTAFHDTDYGIVVGDETVGPQYVVTNGAFPVERKIEAMGSNTVPVDESWQSLPASAPSDADAELHAVKVPPKTQVRFRVDWDGLREQYVATHDEPDDAEQVDVDALLDAYGDVEQRFMALPYPEYDRHYISG